MPMPNLDSFEKYYGCLAQMVAKTSWLPHPDIVNRLPSAVFPTIRARSGRPRCTTIIENGEIVGMYDDNTSPTWALLWSHGITGGNRHGWGFAHVWTAADDINAYTNIANLAMIPECFGSLTDKEGPLTSYLQWHAWSNYHWKPENTRVPLKPSDYDNIQWRYFHHFEEPRQFIQQRIEELNNERVRILRPIMERRGLL